MQTTTISPARPEGASLMPETYYTRWERLYARERNLFNTAQRLAASPTTRGTPVSLRASDAWFRASSKLTSHERDFA